MEFEKTFVFADWSIDSNITLDQDKKGNNTGEADYDGYTLLGRMVVPPQLRWGLGHKRLWFSPVSGGLFVVLLRDTSGNIIEGKAKVVFVSATGDRKIPVYEAHTRTMYRTDPTDKSKNQLVCYGLNTPNLLVKSDGEIRLYFKADVDDTVINYLNTNNLIVIDYLEVHE